MIFFTSSKKPCSIQGNRDNYKIELASEFKEMYPMCSPMLDIGLYSNLLYFTRGEKKGCEKDVDNLSKPIIDAFNGVIYGDDKQIRQRIVTKIVMNDYDIKELELSNLPDDIVNSFIEFIAKNEPHIILLEIGDFDNNMIKVGLRA